MNKNHNKFKLKEQIHIFHQWPHKLNEFQQINENNSTTHTSLFQCKEVLFQ